MLDLSNVQSQKPTGLPDGKYVCSVVKAEMKDTKSGGMMIVATFNVVEGECEGRKVFHNFNVQNANAKATEIGLSQLKSLLENSGYKDPNKLGAVTDLEGLRVGVKTKTQRDETYGDKTVVSYFFKPEAAGKTDNIPF